MTFDTGIIKNVPTVGDIMSEWIVVLSPDMDIYKAIEIFAKKRASGAPVLDESGELIGILTEKDCLRVLSNSAYGQLAHGNVSNFMSTIKVTVEKTADLFSVAREFLTTNFAVLPVLEDGKLAGRISRQDMLKGIEEMERRIERERKEEEVALKRMQNPKGIEAMQTLVGSQKREHSAAVLRHRHEKGDGI